MNRLLLAIVIMAFTAPLAAFADGQADFNANCGACHGGTPKTNAKRATMLKVDAKKLYLPASDMDNVQMIAITEKGKGPMPAFDNKLTKEQISAIVDYIKGLSKK